MIATANPPNEAFGDLITLKKGDWLQCIIYWKSGKLREEGKNLRRKKVLILEPM